MALPEKDIDLIDKHLQGRLTTQEQITFAVKSKNKEFEEELNFRKNLQAASAKSGRNDLKAHLKNLESEIKRKKTPTKKAKTRRLSPFTIGIAAGLALAVFALSQLLQPPQNAELYAAYAQPYPNVLIPIQKSGDNNTPKPDETAMASYENGDFALAFSLLQALEPGGPGFDFYAGISAMRTDKDVDAETLFLKTAQTNSKFKVPAQYYLALLYLKTDRTEEAKQYLKIVEQEGQTPTLRKNASEILEKL